MNTLHRDARSRRGQVLAGVVLIVMVLLIIVPAMVMWVREESRSSVKDRKSTVAFNLAEAGTDRAIGVGREAVGAGARAGGPGALRGGGRQMG